MKTGLNDLSEKCHTLAVEKGFWGLICDCKHDKKVIKEYDTCPRCGRNWNKKERNLSELLMLIVSELGEACEALRKNNRQTYGTFIDGTTIPPTICHNTVIDERWEKDTFEDEIADAFIRLFDLCGALKINIEWQIEKKLEYNKTRPQMHGKKF